MRGIAQNSPFRRYEKIGMRAFEGCTALSEINIPESVEYFGYEAFKGCASLTSIKIPAKASIEESAFAECPIGDQREAAANERKQKELEKEQAEMRKQKKEQDELDRKREEFERKQREAERKREIALDELEGKMGRIADDIERRTGNKSNESGSTFTWLILIVCGICVGIYVHSKQKQCSFAESAVIFFTGEFVMCSLAFHAAQPRRNMI